MQPSPLRGSGCNTLSHSGLANVLASLHRMGGSSPATPLLCKFTLIVDSVNLKEPTKIAPVDIFKFYNAKHMMKMPEKKKEEAANQRIPYILVWTSPFFILIGCGSKFQ